MRSVGTFEARFGHRYVIFVAGRSRAQILPLLEASLETDASAERERAIRDVVAIARDRALRSGLMDEASAPDVAPIARWPPSRRAHEEEGP